MTRRLISLGVLTLALGLLVFPTVSIVVAQTLAQTDDTINWMWWYYGFCSADGKQLVTDLAMILGAGFGARLLGDFQIVQRIPLLGVLIHFVGVNWPAILSMLMKGADQAAAQAKKAVMLLAVVGACTWCSACAELGLTGNPIADAPAIAADVTKGCKDYAVIAAPLAVVPDPTVKTLTGFGSGLCDLATGAVLATAIPNIDPNTGLWIQGIVGALKAAQGLTAPAPVAAPAKS